MNTAAKLMAPVGWLVDPNSALVIIWRQTLNQGSTHIKHWRILNTDSIDLHRVICDNLCNLCSI